MRKKISFQNKKKITYTNATPMHMKIPNKNLIKFKIKI